MSSSPPVFRTPFQFGLAAAALASSLFLCNASAGAADLTASPASRIASEPFPDNLVNFVTGEFTATVSGYGIFGPSFEGSKHYTFFGYPLVTISRKSRPDCYTAPDDSASFALYETEFFRIGPALGVDLPRYYDRERALFGLNKVATAIDPGLFVEILPTNFFRVRAEFLQGLGGQHGETVSFSADVFNRFAENWLFAVGPRLSLATSDALSPYFDVTPARSILSGLPVYKTGGGFRDVGATAVLRYHWTPRIETELYGEYRHLLADVADSPLVHLRGTTEQFKMGVTLSYKFDFLSPIQR